MKHFSNWIDPSGSDSPLEKVFVERDVPAPTFKDACSLIFGNHIWFNLENLAFRGDRLHGERIFSSWEIASIDTSFIQTDALVH